MPEFWLDSNTFIEANKGPYGFDIAPGFWLLIEQKAEESVVSSSSLVFDELVNDFEDDLADWAKTRKDSNLFADPDELVQESFRLIAEYVNANYEQNQAFVFLGGADPWLIAHALAYGGQVVTQEVKVSASSKKVKIPNVAEVFGVGCLNTYQMIRQLGASLELSN